jgi:hypothetical protein
MNAQKGTVMLVHGAWADGAGGTPVLRKPESTGKIPLLRRVGPCYQTEFRGLGDVGCCVGLGGRGSRFRDAEITLGPFV